MKKYGIFPLIKLLKMHDPSRVGILVLRLLRAWFKKCFQTHEILQILGLLINKLRNDEKKLRRDVVRYSNLGELKSHYIS